MDITVTFPGNKKVDGEMGGFVVQGREEEQAALLDEVRSLGTEVTSFSEAGNPLESLYMSLIKESR